MGKALFITGTGTDVGKSAASLAILLWASQKGLRSAYYKPVQCGTFPFGTPSQAFGDADWIRNWVDPETSTRVTYKFTKPVSPHLAAESDGKPIELELIERELDSLRRANDLLIVEGAGGAAVPLNREGVSLATLAARKSIYSLIVCAPGLGTLHHTLSTMAFLKAVNAPMAGFAFCHRDAVVPETCADNIRTLQALTRLPFFGELPYDPGLASGDEGFRNRVASWYAPMAEALDTWWNQGSP